MDDSELILSKAWLNLDLPPSCVQFCRAHPRYFVVGTYNLEQDDPKPAGEEQEDSSVVKKPQSRNGSLVLFRVEGDDLLARSATSLHLLAVLMITWTGPKFRLCRNHLLF